MSVGGDGDVAALRFQAPCRHCRARRGLPRRAATGPASRPARARGRRRRRRGPSSGSAQWRKCRMPVNTIAMPCSSAAAITSASRMRAAGLDDGADAELAATSRPSRNGKKASEAMTLPAIGEARVRGLHRGDARRDRPGSIWPAPMPIVRAVPHEHDRVRLHELADSPGEEQVGELGRRRAARRVTILSVAASMMPSSRRLHAAGRRRRT